jgi:hypothetical protein
MNRIQPIDQGNEIEAINGISKWKMEQDSAYSAANRSYHHCRINSIAYFNLDQIYFQIFFN